MDSQQPRGESGAKPGTNSAGATGGVGTPAVRTYPKPPGFLVRMILLCLKPEAWAGAAR